MSYEFLGEYKENCVNLKNDKLTYEEKRKGL